MEFSEEVAYMSVFIMLIVALMVGPMVAGGYYTATKDEHKAGEAVISSLPHSHLSCICASIAAAFCVLVAAAHTLAGTLKAGVWKWVVIVSKGMSWAAGMLGGIVFINCLKIGLGKNGHDIAVTVEVLFYVIVSLGYIALAAVWCFGKA